MAPPKVKYGGQNGPFQGNRELYRLAEQPEKQGVFTVPPAGALAPVRPQVAPDHGSLAGSLPGQPPHITKGADRAREWAAIRARAERLLKLRGGFDPSQPRDEHGEWTGGGGSEGGEGADSGGRGPAGEPASARPEDSGGRAGGSSGAFSGHSPIGAESSGDVKTVYGLDEPHRSAWAAADRTPLTFHELKSEGSQRFHDAIAAAKAATPWGAAVELHTPDQYKATTNFVTPDGKAGFALDGDNIVSVFKHPGSSAKGFAPSALALATQLGGRRLDAFDTALPRLYSQGGFRAVARLPFDPQYAPPGWSEKQYAEYNGGRPDVVFMVHDPAHAAAYKPGDGKTVATYDEGIAAQHDALAKLAKKLRGGFDPGEPRDEHGEWTGGGGEGGGAAAAEAAKPAEKPKGKTKTADFAKDGVRLDNDTINNKAKAEKFVERWNERIGEAPAEFRKSFLGGLDGTMNIEYHEPSDKIMINGNLQDHGATIGTYNREINLKDNKAYSAYFKLNKNIQGGNVGKALLAGNVAMYQKLGLDKVEVSANIDVGGYAWAKYGYVPTMSSWASLSSQLRNKLRGDVNRPTSRGGNTYTPESWDEIGDHDQDRIRDAWMSATQAEFVDSEIENWRDSGQALDDAKGDLADNFSSDSEWAKAALTSWRDQREEAGNPAVPFSNEQILDAISIDYQRGYDGRGDADITIDDDKLDKMQPEGFDEAQQTLPGMKPITPHEMLTPSARDEIEKELSKAFDSEADDKAADMEPPDYLDENVGEFQGEYWDQMEDRERFRWAERNGELPDYPLDEDEEEKEPEPQAEMPLEDSDQNTALMKLASSGDPKAIWAIADSAQGKNLLLNTNWVGVLNLKDKQAMDRFNAYVGKRK